MNGNADVVYSPTQEKLLQILGDGEYHTRKELQENCTSVTRNSKTIDVHLSLLRKKLFAISTEEVRLNIIPIYEARETTYQLVKIVPATIKDVKPA